MPACKDGCIPPHLVPVVCWRIEELQREHDLPLRYLHHVVHGRQCQDAGAAKSDYPICYEELARLAEDLGMTPADAFPQVFVRYDEEHVTDTVHLDDQVVPRLLRDQLYRQMNTLTDREQRILCLYYFDGATQPEIARREGLSRNRVWQIKEKALRKLRHPGICRHLKDFLRS